MLARGGSFVVFPFSLLYCADLNAALCAEYCIHSLSLYRLSLSLHVFSLSLYELSLSLDFCAYFM
jgi:hypothetical protein